MKTLVVVYSKTGTSRQLARLLAQLKGWTLAEVTEPAPDAAHRSDARCAVDSLLQRCPAIRYDGPPPQDFDVVVLVSPIWMRRLSSPMRSFVTTHRHALRQVAVLSVMGGEGAPNAVAEIGRLLHRSPLFSTAVTTREVECGSAVARLDAFGTAIERALDPEPPLRPAVWSAETA